MKLGRVVPGLYARVDICIEQNKKTPGRKTSKIKRLSLSVLQMLPQPATILGKLWTEFHCCGVRVRASGAECTVLVLRRTSGRVSADLVCYLLAMDSTLNRQVRGLRRI